MMRSILWGLLCALLLALSVPGDAQPPKKLARLGYLAAVSAAADAPRLEAFRQGLRELGYIEGQNMLIEFRHEGGGFGRLPTLSRVAVLWDPQAPGSVPQWHESQRPAQALGLQLYSLEVSSVEAYEAAFQAAVEARNTALWMTLNPLANSNQKKLADLAIQHGLPSICARADYAENGCMMAYGPGYSIEGRDGARYVDKILQGTRPANIPVEQPLKFELVINLQTADKLGLTIPPSVLFQADRIIK